MGKFRLRRYRIFQFQALLWLCLVVALCVISFIIHPESVNAAVTKTMKACHICETAFPPISPTVTPTPDAGLCDIKCVDPNQTSEVTKEVLVPETSPNPKDALNIQYYWMDGCPGCEEVLDTTISMLEQKYGTLIAIQKIELKTLEDVDQLYVIGEGFNLPKEKIGVPFVVVGGLALSGVDQIREELPGIVLNLLNNTGMIPTVAKTPILDSTNQISLTSSSEIQTNKFYWIGITFVLVLAGLVLFKIFIPRLKKNRKEKNDASH